MIQEAIARLRVLLARLDENDPDDRDEVARILDWLEENATEAN